MKVFLLIFVVCAACASLDLGLGSDLLVHVQNDPVVSHLVEFEISQGEFQTPATTLGVLKVALFADVAPLTCAHFVQNAKTIYKDTVFHRIIEDFMVQGGGMKMTDEGRLESVDFERFDDEPFVLHHDKLGRLSMANAGPNTNGCQFFITTGPKAPHLDGNHVVFGQLVAGFDVLSAMNTVEVHDSSPKTPVYISKVSVSEVSMYPVSNVEPVSSGYSFLMFFCVLATAAYGLHRYTSRRSFVDLSSFKI